MREIHPSLQGCEQLAFNISTHFHRSNIIKDGGWCLNEYSACFTLQTNYQELVPQQDIAAKNVKIPSASTLLGSLINGGQVPRE